MSELGGKGTVEALGNLRRLEEFARSEDDHVDYHGLADEIGTLNHETMNVLRRGTDPDQGGIDPHDSRWVDDFRDAHQQLASTDPEQANNSALGSVIALALARGGFSADFIDVVGDDIVDMDKAVKFTQDEIQARRPVRTPPGRVVAQHRRRRAVLQPEDR
ncbi:MAG: hypothetical protein ACRDQ7_24735 [Haloechinothrix sp.]